MDWQYLVNTAPTRSYKRTSSIKTRLLCRYVSKSAFDKASTPSFLYASGNTGRCNPAGIQCIYFGEGPNVARAEFDSYFTEPLSELGFYGRISLRHILDLENKDTIHHFNLRNNDFTKPYITISGKLIPLQEIGKAISKQNKVSAIRYPSNAMLNRGAKGYNIVIFRDSISTPDYLEIIDGINILERWPIL